ncbi:MAG TPA: HipA domain-containing protein [Candidatus Tumulicola sp.]|nr:HipA domain-containing protein [Candidatus Tumulicola sp.]
MLGRRVGYLTNLPDDSTVFGFDAAYLEDPQRPTLSLAFLNDDGSVNLQAAHRVQRLTPPFFSNLLPEGSLRALVARKLNVSAERDFPLLAELGADLPGAVVLGSAEPVAPPPSEALTFSLPGVQLKLSALLAENDALTIPAHGAGGDWIVKIGAGRYPGLVENEFSMMRFAEAVGIRVPNIRLVEPDHVKGLPPEFQSQGPAFAIERFDRARGGTRVHVEDFNQVFAQFPHDKYERRTYGDVARVVYRHAGATDAYDLVRRLVFSIAIGNSDAHLKNWSLLYPDGRQPRLAPAYDYVSTLTYDLDHRTALSFGESKEPHDVDADRLRRFARGADLSLKDVRSAARDVADAMSSQLHVLRGLPIFDDQCDAVERHVSTLVRQIHAIR